MTILAKKLALALCSLALGCGLAAAAHAQTATTSTTTATTTAGTTTEQTVIVGGAPMYPSKDIIDNAVNSKDHTTLVTAIKSAGLVETLKGPGPFTVFAPTDAAFKKLPKGTIDTLLKPENKAKLTDILTYHVVPGNLSAQGLMAKIKQGGGTTMLTTVEGDTLTVTKSGDKLVLTDTKGNKANVTVADAVQSNGIIHVIDAVLMPKTK